MKKIIFMGILGLFALGSCQNHHSHNHEGTTTKLTSTTDTTMTATATMSTTTTAMTMQPKDTTMLQKVPITPMQQQPATTITPMKSSCPRPKPMQQV